MIERVSQSFMKMMRGYLRGEECGNVLKYQYVDGKFMNNASAAMKLGAYFEFMAFGNLPKDGKIPVAEYNKDGKTMSMEYKRATVNATRIKETFDKIGIVVIEKGKKYTKGRNEGTIDLVVEFTNDWGNIKAGTRAVIDLKYSGLLHNYYETHGWGDDRGWSDQQKKYHGTQAIHYSFITSLPFFFWVTGNSNTEKENEETGKKEFDTTDFKVMSVPVDEHMIDVHLNEGNYLMEAFKKEVAMPLGLKAYPDYKKCAKCSLYESCKDKHTVPYPSLVDLTLGI